MFPFKFASAMEKQGQPARGGNRKKGYVVEHGAGETCAQTKVPLDSTAGPSSRQTTEALANKSWVRLNTTACTLARRYLTQSSTALLQGGMRNG